MWIFFVYSMGLILFCAYGLQTLLNRKKSSKWVVVSAKCLVAFTVFTFVARTVVRNSDWLSRPTIIKWVSVDNEGRGRKNYRSVIETFELEIHGWAMSVFPRVTKKNDRRPNLFSFYELISQSLLNWWVFSQTLLKVIRYSVFALLWRFVSLE